MFHVRRRPADYHPRKRKKKPQQTGKWGKDGVDRYDDNNYERLPFFLELNPGGCSCSVRCSAAVQCCSSVLQWSAAASEGKCRGKGEREG